ncbi:MAG TPA: VWA domain-containing protein [Pyrinomonadaceae bacterium]|jgi:VWFA-related protein
MKKFSFALVICLLTTISIFAQQTNPTPPATDEDDVVKITTKLVQLDAIVTDEKGNQVTDLTAADFEVLQDGKPQKITNFSYVNTVAPNSAPVKIEKKDRNAILPPSPAVTGRSSGGRLITFVVDNCTASASGIYAAREALNKFIRQQMLPGDMVAIYQTTGGSSLLQQFTSDREQLLHLVRKIIWYPNRGCLAAGGPVFEPIRDDLLTETDKKIKEAAEDASRDIQSVSVINVLNYIVRGLGRVGGRKVVFLLSDGIPLRTRTDKPLGTHSVRTEAALRGLTDTANRAAVVFNTIDTRGLVNTDAIEAVDDVSGRRDVDGGNSNAEKVAQERRSLLFGTQDGLNFLARETGGTFSKNQNFLDVPIGRALNLEKGYYLLAYEPDDETFKGKNFNQVSIKVSRPGLKVVSRAGFLGRVDEKQNVSRRTGDSELYEAAVAPLPRTGMNLRLTAFFGNAAAKGNFVRALLHVDGKDITFIDDANGSKKVALDVFAVTLDEKNDVVDEFNHTHKVLIPAEAVQLIRQNGLVYSVDVPVKKDGTYNFRLAIRDANSKMLGSASQIIQVPALKKDKIFLSGLTVSQVDETGKFSVPAEVKPENAITATPTTSIPAIRQFQRGMVMAYSYTLYNAALDKAANQPKLTVQVNLYREGQLVTQGQPQASQLEKQDDMTRIGDYGYMRLSPNMQPGDYALQVIVKDLLTNQTVSQWVDFQVTQ